MNCGISILLRAGPLVFALLAAAAPAMAQPAEPSRVEFEVEAGPLWATRNDVRIPPDTGTEFSLLDLTGRGPDPFVRVTANFKLAERHGLRLLVAPVGTRGVGTFDAPVHFAGETFAPGVPTDGTFKFNTYRLTYRYTVHAGDTWRVQIGAALLTRDAKIELRQADTVARDTDIGFVPLAYFSAARRLTGRTSLVLDVEGLGAPQGRAIDGALKLNVALTDRWTLGAGYRAIEGGADVESVYTFAWLHFGVVSLGYRF